MLIELFGTEITEVNGLMFVEEASAHIIGPFDEGIRGTFGEVIGSAKGSDDVHCLIELILFFGGAAYGFSSLQIGRGSIESFLHLVFPFGIGNTGGSGRKETDPAVTDEYPDAETDGTGCPAIVNAANSRMLGCFVPMHTCIDNCIHTFAGVQFRAECDRQMQELRAKYGPDYEQPTAVPMLTDGFNLPAKKVIHIVGPIVQYRLTKELEEDLANCYRNTLNMCLENGLKSVAFCCISTGVFRFPNQRAAEIAVQTVTEWMTEHPDTMDRVIFNVFKNTDLGIYNNLLK